MNSTSTQTRFSMASEMMWTTPNHTDVYRAYPSPQQRRPQSTRRESVSGRHNASQSRAAGAEAQSWTVQGSAQSKSNYSRSSNNNKINHNHNNRDQQLQQQNRTGRPRGRGRRFEQQQQNNNAAGVGSVSGGTPGRMGTGNGQRQQAVYATVIAENAAGPNQAYTAYRAQTPSAGPHSTSARPSASSTSPSSSSSSPLSSTTRLSSSSLPPSAHSSPSRATVDSRPPSSSDLASAPSSASSRSYSARSAPRHNNLSCTPTSRTTTPVPTTMTYAAAVAPRRASLTRPSVSVSNKENVCASVESSTEVYEVGQSAVIQPTPRPVGRARSNSFYGRVQHTVLARRRSPPPSPLALVSDNTSLDASNANPASSSKSAHVLTLRQSGLRACAARLDLALGFDSTVNGAVNAALSAASTPVAPVNTTTTTCVQIAVSTSTTESDSSSTTSVRHCSSILSSASSSSLVSLSSPFSSAALHTLRTLTPAPQLLRPTTAVTVPTRDSRSKLVAGLLLNRTKAKPLAAARQRRRALWGCAAASRGEGGVFAGSSLRAEVVF